jgi:hypothetical protein
MLYREAMHFEQVNLDRGIAESWCVICMLIGELSLPRQQQSLAYKHPAILTGESSESKEYQKGCVTRSLAF